MDEHHPTERGDPPPILTLLDLIEEHRPAFEYDWRSRFHLPLTSVPDEMGYGEAYRLLTLLAADPSSQVGAAIQGWSFPASRELLALADSYDLSAKAAGAKRAKPYPRPWPDKDRKTFGRGPGMSPADLDALLRAQMDPDG